MFKEVESIIKKNINKEVKVINRFTGGMSNFTYLIEVDSKLYTYRIPGKNSHVFINREIEKENIELVKQLNLNCENIYLNTTNGHKMSLYIEGNDLSSEEIDYVEVSNKLKLLHNSGVKAVNDYVKEEKLNYYETLLEEKHNEEYFLLKEKLFNYLEEYKDIELVYCHGDAQKSNWIKSDNLYLLDWEYSGNNDPYYDIACFGNVDFNDAIKLLEYYLGYKPNSNELRRLYLNRIFQCMQWYNVALYKKQIGLSKDLNMDFKAISVKYINLTKSFFEKI
ncbi:MAG: phosphotransferase [bacterium]